jgi:hypothetical protein
MRQHELRPDMNEGPKLGSGNHPVNVDFWVQPDLAQRRETEFAASASSKRANS